MPVVNIWMHEGQPAERRKAVSESVHAAMMNVLKTPADVWDHFIYEMPAGNMVYDRNYFGVPRSDAMVFIQFFFNTRPKELKDAFFEGVADEFTKRTGLSRADLLMAIVEVPAENWWAHGRSIDASTGYDTRMAVDKDGR